MRKRGRGLDTLGFDLKTLLFSRLDTLGRWAWIKEREFEGYEAYFNFRE